MTRETLYGMKEELLTAPDGRLIHVIHVTGDPNIFCKAYAALKEGERLGTPKDDLLDEFEALIKSEPHTHIGYLTTLGRVADKDGNVIGNLQLYDAAVRA